MAATDTTKTAHDSWADTAEEWIRRVHHAEMYSAQKVSFRQLTLSEMIALDALPQDLLEIAVAEWSEPGSDGEPSGAMKMVAAPFATLPEKATRKQMDKAAAESRALAQKFAALNREIVAHGLVDPKMTVDELAMVPMKDLELLSGLINGTRSTDAAGRHVGVVPLDTFRVVLAAHGHGVCAAGCEACEEAGRALSSVRGA